VSGQSRSTFKKRQKEIARQQRQQDKLARRLERRQKQKDPTELGAGGEDPDLAGIQPGPQAPSEE
jgi:hypothetical protein